MMFTPDNISALAGIAVGSMYVAKYIPKESKEAVSDMVESIR